MIKIPGYFISSLIIILALSIFSIWIGSRVKKLKVGDEPGKFVALIIGLIDYINRFVRNNIGKHWRYVAPLVLTLGMYIMIANISGLFLLDSPTKYVSITFSLAVFSFIIVQSTGIVSQKWRHVNTWFKPMFFMAPMNILSDITPLISMSLRLFGNIASGSVLVTLIYRLTGVFSPVVALPFHIIFDIAFGLIQTIVFVFLTVNFASNKVKNTDFDILKDKGEFTHE